MSTDCPVCGSTDHSLFITIDDIPVHCNLLLDRREEALQVARGDINLTLCKSCGHVYNASFDPALMEYSGSYENSLHYSERFREYTEWLANQLIERYCLYEKTIAEIGCGQGDFLRLICNMGRNTGIGYDPSYREDTGGAENNHGVRIVKEFYSDRLYDVQADFIICRHVLEHIYDPQKFLSMINSTVEDYEHTQIFFEVPSLFWTLRDLSIWDIIYEHYSYFSSYSLSRLFAGSGFSVHGVYETYEKQFLCIEASKSARNNGHISLADDSIQELVRYTETFKQKFQDKITESRRLLEKSEGEDKRVVLWGAGSKGVTFMNMLNVKDPISYVVDINPRKHGKHIAGTGQEIVSPESLRDYNPDHIIVMNPIYLNEIKEYVRNQLGLNSQLLTL